MKDMAVCQMGLENPQWINKWSQKKYPRLYPDFCVHGFGTDGEPGTSYWMATLLDPMGEYFREGVTILDYGCGCARLFNFITGYLKDFKYYGAEPEGGQEIEKAELYFKDDPRAFFMTCEEAIKSKEAMSCDVVILGSIFTHLLEGKCEAILESLWPIIDNGGMIIFTAIFKQEAQAIKPGAHGFKDCYGVSYQRIGWIEDLEQKFSCEIICVNKFQTGVLQNIFRIQ